MKEVLEINFKVAQGINLICDLQRFSGVKLMLHARIENAPLARINTFHTSSREKKKKIPREKSFLLNSTTENKNASPLHVE